MNKPVALVTPSLIWGSTTAFLAPLAPIAPLTELEKKLQAQPRYAGFQRGNQRVTFDVCEWVLR